MSDLSIKSEGYSSFLRDAKVPSTPLCCYIISITLIYYGNISGKYGTVVAFIFFLLFIITLTSVIPGYKNFFSDKKTNYFLIIFITLFCILFSFFINRNIKNLINTADFPQSIENTSIVINEIKLKRYSSEIYFTTFENRVKHLRGIINYYGDLDFNKGDILFIHKKIKKINSEAESLYNNYLISRGIHFTANLNDSDITVLQKSPPGFHSLLQKNLLLRIDSIFPQVTSGLIKALFTGNQNYLGKKVIIQYRNSGVLHCLAASGLHVAIFASVPAFLLIPLVRRNIAMTGSLLAVMAYFYITDMPVSLLRAVIMFALFYVQLLLFRGKNLFNYLMITCSFVLLISPWEIFRPGFQLSFAATAGIIIFYKQYRKSFTGFPGIIADMLAVTVAAQIFTLPIILFHMKQINTAGIISNLIIIPIITIIMGIAFFNICVSFFSLPCAIFFGNITNMIFKLSLGFTDFVYSLKLNFFVDDISLILFIIFIISLIPLINCRTTLKMKFYPVVVSIILCTLYLKKFYHYNNNNFIIYSNGSRAEVKIEKEKKILKLNLIEGADIEYIITSIKIKNADIKVIELENVTNSSLIVSKKIMNDYIIDEFRFNMIPELNSLFKKTISQLEKDNVIIKFTENNYLN